MSIRTLYLYLFSFVGLLIIIIGSIQLIDLGFKVFIFTDADRYEFYPPEYLKNNSNPLSEEEIAKQQQQTQELQQRELTRQRQRQLSTSLSMILVGTPIYLYHWTTISRDSRRKH